MNGGTPGRTSQTASAMLEEALVLYREIGDTAGEGNILWGLGELPLLHGGRQRRPKRWYRQALDASSTASGQRTMEAWSLHMLSLSADRPAALR